MQSGEVTDMKEFHKDNTVDFLVKFQDPMDQIEIDKKLKLSSSISGYNFTLFDHQGRIKRYADELEILAEFFDLRLSFYQKRKAHQLKILSKEMTIL